MCLRSLAALEGPLLALVCAGGGGAPSPNSPPPRQTEGLTFDATSSLDPSSPDHLIAVVTIRNAGRAPVTLESGGCSVLTRLYATAHRIGVPVYDQASAIAKGRTACPAIAFEKTLQPGESHRFATLAITGEVLSEG